MLAAFTQAIIGAATALIGVVVTFWLHRRAARKNQLFNLVVAMMTAIDAHRFAMWVMRETHHISGRTDGAHLARTEETRNAITGPRLSLKVVNPRLGAVADTTVAVTFAMHGSKNIGDLEQRRLAARDAAHTFELEALSILADAGIGVPGADLDRDPASRNHIPTR